MRDIIGIALIAFAFMSLFAILEFTRNQTAESETTTFVGGFILNFVAGGLTLWFGWGSFIVLFAVGYLGYAFLWRGSGEVRWGRIIALELAALLTLGLFAAVSGNDLLLADAGMYGGRLGWGMVMLTWRYMGEIVGTLIIFLLWLLMASTGFGLWAKLETWLLHLAGEAPPVVISTPTPDSAPVSGEQHSQQAQPEKSAAQKKKAPQIPPEFRTSLSRQIRKRPNPPSPCLVAKTCRL